MAGLPGGPVQAPPRGIIPQAEQAQILSDVLAGIELGAWDRQIVQWLANWDTCTVLTVASLIARARAAGVAGPGDDPAGRVTPGASTHSRQPMAHYDQNKRR
jgi:hypothetical protein